MTIDVDTLVVGGGVMGSATTWELARRGRGVTLLERFSAGHANGASHGATRNFSSAYAAPTYLDLLLEARRRWRELEEETGTVLLDFVGLVNHGDEEPWRVVHDALAARGEEVQLLDSAQAMRRWPGMRFRSRVLLIPDAGRVRAAHALRTLQSAARARGADVRFDTPVRDIRPVRDDEVEVVTDSETFTARRVVVTVGAWTEKLLGRRVALPRLVVTQEQPAHFQPVEGGERVRWPSFNHTPDPRAREDDYWLSPTYGMLTPGEGVKVGWHGVGPVTDPDARSFEPEPMQLATLQRYAREWLPGVDADRCQPISCTYTSTDSSDFVLDRVGPLTFGAGFSGHGFKFTPAVGRILADLVDGVASPERFRVRTGR